MKTLTRMGLLFALSILILLAAAGTASAAVKLSGHVTAANGGAPIASAWVWVCRADNTTYASLYTDATGLWETYVGDGAYKVGVGATLFITEWHAGKPDVTTADPITVAGSPVSGVDFALADAPQGHLTGKLTDARSGKALAGALVEGHPTVQGNGYYGSTTSAADGTYDLALSPGAYTVWYYKAGYRWVYYDGTKTGTTDGYAAQTYTVTGGLQAAGVDAAVPPDQTAVFGRTYDVDDNALSGIVVQLLDAGDGHVVDSVASDALGEFKLDLYDRVGGSYKIRCHDPSGTLLDEYFSFQGQVESAAAADVLTPQLGASHSFLPILSAPQPGHIAGHTLDAHGLPVSGVTVRVDRSFAGGGYQVMSDAAGAYDVSLKVAAHSSFTVSFQPGLANPTYSGQVYDGKQPDEPGDRVAVAPGQTVTIDSSLSRRCSISGTVNAPDSGAVSKFVTLYDAEGAVVATRQILGDWYQFTDLTEGSYRLFFHDTEGRYRDQYYNGVTTSLADATVVTVDATTPTRTVDVTLAPWGRIDTRAYAEGTLYTALPGVTMGLYDGAGKLVASGAADSSGSYAFGYLELGTYFVGCSSPGGLFLDGFFGDASTLAQATPITLTAAQPQGYADITLAERRGVPPAAAARPDGAQDTSTSLIVTPTSLAAGGDTAVCGDFWDGTARVFTHAADGWSLAARLKPTGDEENLYGRHVAADGDTVAVSDFNETGANRDGAGKVWIYRRTGGDWALEQLLKPSGAAYRSFGRALALSGDTLLVGAPDVKVGDENLAGVVYVFVRSGSAWTQRAKLTCADVNVDDAFGQAIALQGSTAVIAAPRKDWAGHNCGGIVFVFTGSGADWKQRAAIKPSDGLFVMDFGEAVALDAGTIAAGCADSPEAGAVYVYTGSGASWVQQARLAPTDGQVGWEMGHAVAIDGDTILTPAAIGVDAPAGYAPGVGYVFRRTGSSWHQDAELKAPYHGDRHWSIGESVAIAGGDFLVSAPGEQRDPNAYGWLHAFHPYVTGLGQTLDVPAGNGVLVNDASPTGGSLTATLAAGPVHGALDLHADGSFTYAPAQDWAGDDTFTYTAGDGTWTSDAATVTVTTRDPNAPNVSAQDVPMGWVDSPVTVTLSASDDTQVREIDYRRHTSKPVAWTTYDKPFTVTAQGATAYQLRALDVFGNASRTGTVTVKVDTRLPVPKVPKPCKVVRGRTAAIQYLIADPRPGSPTANVEIRVLRSGKEKWNARLPGRPVGKLLTCAYRCTLPRGVYTLLVTAIDAAGNAAARPAKSTLTVR